MHTAWIFLYPERAQKKYLNTEWIKYLKNWGAWVAQWVKASAFSSGHDLRVLGYSPASGSLLCREPASPLFLPASLPTCDFSLSHK